ncbi:tetratricopeptide repeat protein [Algoriphagus confluentis]|uniref:Tetratricopeptide repeat protein n=1 Tax=Algoriphagus confluentis TaxID=1697556 RepID=A0ABQ6PIB7_9BACT|nr:hypothetical protein Aconfl_03040 [Algoriphagus confluentis]
MDQDELINAYLDGKLSPDDKRLFEQLLQEDPVYLQALEEQRQIKLAVTLEERSKLKDFLREIDRNEARLLAKTNSLKSWLFAGVAACLIVLVGYFLWTSLSTTPGEKLYQTYYQTYPNLVAPTVRGSSSGGLKSEAFLAFDNRDYEKAAVLFENLIQEPNSEFAIFYLGICQLELGRPEKAIPSFQKIKENASQPDKPTALWYEAMGYFKLNKLEEAKLRIGKVAQANGHALQSQAQEIFQKLE